MRAMGAFYFGHLAIHGMSILKFGAFYVLMFLMVGLFEEFLLRGYMQYTLTTGMGFWPTAILLSASFGALHGGNNGEAMLGLVAAALIGLFFCLTLRRTGSLWFAVGFHMSWDWGESFFYSTPDSGQMSPGHLLNSSFQGSRWITGGSVGPEGSVLVLIVIVIMWIIFDRQYRSIKYPVLSRENQVLPSGLGLQAPAENL
ncbi:MAG: CPBP family intramembrane metalloprotease [Acidobacteriales bacterium]|nr:CPBP family intramembrane metalloprotease [Terriglobales bacterium]